MVERTMHNGKRIYASTFKAWLVEQARVPGVSVSGLALRHGVNIKICCATGRAWSAGAQLPMAPSCCP